jgi:hypothetical protein
MGLRLGVIAAVTLLAGVAAAPARGAKADLAVTNVAGAPASAPTGTAPSLKVTVKNEGRGRSKKAKLFSLVVGEAGGAVGGKFGKASVGPIDPGRKRRVTFRPKVPFEAVGEWHLSVCVNPGKAANDCDETGVIEFTDGSTIGRIDAALADGDLTDGEALLHKLQAVTGDAGLPDQYDGGGPIQNAVVMADVVGAYSTLPVADQSQVAPYMLQPRYAESAWAPPATRTARAGKAALRGSDPCSELTNLAGAWTGVPSSHAIFWHRPGNSAAQAKAQTLSAAFEAKVWPDLTGAFVEVNDSAAAPCDPAGDGRIDFYINSGNALLAGGREGVTPPLWLGGPCGPTPSFVVLKGSATRQTVAHEFMHVIQWAYRACERAPAWVEGTAVWAAHYVYENDNVEHLLKTSLESPFLALRDPALGDHAWPFWYSLENYEDVDAIVRVYEALASADLAGALEQGPSDGLEEAWKRYAVERWNQSPIGQPGFPLTRSFKQADGFTAKPLGVPIVDVKLGGLPEKLFPMTTFERRPLSTWFHRVKITDPLVRELEFKKVSGTVVQAFLKLENGNWRLEDWSDQAEVKLCRDKPDENVTEMVIATSNPLATGSPLGVDNHLLTARDICEQPTYTGTYSGTSRFTGPVTDLTTNFDGTMTLSPYDGFGASGREWEITGGTLDITSFDGTIGECTVSGAGQFALPAFNQENAPAMVLSQGKYYLNIPWIIHNPPQSLDVTWGPAGTDCEDADPEYPVHGVGQFLTLSPNGVTPAPNGTLAVTDVSSDGDPNWEHDSFEFTFVPLP